MRWHSAIIRIVLVSGVLVGLLGGVAQAALTVNSTADPGDGVCDATECTLREAIAAANANPGTDMIEFNLSGAGPHTIQPTSALPAITDPVVIDGYTQSGASANTNPPGLGSNAVLQIELDGTLADTGPPPPSIHGVIIGAGGSTVRGLVINRFVTGDGIRISTPTAGIGGPGGNVVEGNFIGTDVTGTVALGNNRAVSVFNPNNTIGGTTPEARNVLSGNGTGVWMQDELATGNLVEGNYIGTAADGISPLGNTADGVTITRSVFGIGAADNVIGGGASGAGNTIAFNGRVGVFIQEGSVRNAILSNSIFSNGVSQPAPLGLGIDLVVHPPGVTPNDMGDGDTGPNNLQNFPELTFATTGRVEGMLNSIPNTTFRLEFFGNSACDPSGFGEGENFLGATTVTTDGSGNTNFTAIFPVPPGQWLTATATDPANNTSEFSKCDVEVAGAEFIDIDIKPGSDPNAINPRSKGVIPVAILTTESFNAQIVDPSTVQFGPSGAGIGHRSAHLQDVDEDGDLDLVLHFRTQQTGIACGDTTASLTGETFGGIPIQGSQNIVTVGCKKEQNKKWKAKKKK